MLCLCIYSFGYIIPKLKCLKIAGLTFIVVQFSLSMRGDEDMAKVIIYNNFQDLLIRVSDDDDDVIQEPYGMSIRAN